MGEAGKGFAVVADEIRKLADQSKESAADIALIIAKLQEDTNNAVEAVGLLNNANKEQNTLVKETEIVFGDINRHVNEVSGEVSNSYEKINEITQFNEKIVGAISNISEVSEETTASSQEAAALSQEHINQLERAKQLVDELISISDGLKKYM